MHIYTHLPVSGAPCEEGKVDHLCRKCSHFPIWAKHVFKVQVQFQYERALSVIILFLGWKFCCFSLPPFFLS